MYDDGPFASFSRFAIPLVGSAQLTSLNNESDHGGVAQSRRSPSVVLGLAHRGLDCLLHVYWLSNIGLSM